MKWWLLIFNTFSDLICFFLWSLQLIFYNNNLKEKLNDIIAVGIIEFLAL